MLRRFEVAKFFLAALVAFGVSLAPGAAVPTLVCHAVAQDEGGIEAIASATSTVTLEPSERLQQVFQGVPENTDDLKAMESHIQALSEKVVPCTVAVQIRGGMGSGVIISEDGYVLTAGHVVGKPDRDVTLLTHDGRRLKGKTLGANYGIDSGLIKITDEGKYKFAELGDSAKVKAGQWCLATGHPGGFEKVRGAPLRVGRVLHKIPGAIITDCTLVGGDSGGPLFDMSGRIIGIHSRIGDGLKANVHVPVNTYRETWDRLAKSEAWGGRRPGGPVIGVVGEVEADEAVISRVIGGSPAEDAGIKIGDVILSFDGKKTASFNDLASAVSEKEPGDRVKIKLRRDEETIEVELIVGRLGE